MKDQKSDVELITEQQDRQSVIDETKKQIAKMKEKVRMQEKQLKQYQMAGNTQTQILMNLTTQVQALKMKMFTGSYSLLNYDRS